MSRWINPLSPKDARIAAKLLCRKYPTRDEVYVKKLKSMSITELREERKQTLEIQRKFNSKTSFLYEYSGHDIKIIDAELQRRRH